MPYGAGGNQISSRTVERRKISRAPKSQIPSNSDFRQIHPVHHFGAVEFQRTVRYSTVPYATVPHRAAPRPAHRYSIRVTIEPNVPYVTVPYVRRVKGASFR